jgi:transposase
MIPNRTYFSATSDVIAEETGYWGTLSDEQWDTVRSLFPSDSDEEFVEVGRSIVEAILWALRHGSLWSDLPEGFPLPDIIVRHLDAWCESEAARETLCIMANDWPGTRSQPLMRLVEIVRGPDLASSISAHTLNNVELSVRHMSSDLYAVLTPVEAHCQGVN